MSSTSQGAVGLVARPRWRASCLVISLLAVAAISAAQPTVTFSVYPVPRAGNGYGITLGPDGALWFTANDSIGRITTEGLLTQYPVANGVPWAITVGPDGALWFAEYNGKFIGRITTGGAITEYPLPAVSTTRWIWRITTGPDGALWFTEYIGSNGRIGRITIAGDISEYALAPCPGTCGRYPRGITTGPDGALWFTDIGDGRLHRITTTGSISDFGKPGEGLQPGDIILGPDGALWFTAGDSGGPDDHIGRITTAGAITTYPLPIYPRPSFNGYNNLGPASVITGPDGALWFAASRVNVIGRITTAGDVALYPLPPIPYGDDFVQVRSMTVGPDGALWISNPGFIVRASLTTDTTPPVITPQVTGTLGSNGWYRSNVTVNWNVTDPESGIASSTGCGTTTLSVDTPGVTLTCSATNEAGLSASKAITIKIDQTPPVISGMPGPGCSIWPPNHKMVQVATVTAADAMSGVSAGSFKVTGTSNEPPSGPQISIVQSAGAYSVALLAERSSDGSGRVYTLGAVANDQAGNTTTATAICTVPHDRGN